MRSQDANVFVVKTESPASTTMAGLPPDVVRVDYISALDGLSDWALLQPPTTGDTWVVFLHGHRSKGDQIFTRADLTASWLVPIRVAGLGIVSANLRENAWMSPAAADDLHELLGWLRKTHKAGRFLFFSGSMGGTSNLIYATLYPEDCAVVVALGAATDLAEYYAWGMQHAPGIQREIAEAIATSYGGTPDQIPNLYHKHSPLFNANRLTMPLYLAHGEHDALMPVAQMRALAGKLAGKSNGTYVEIPSGNHDSPCFHKPALAWLLQTVEEQQ